MKHHQATLKKWVEQAFLQELQIVAPLHILKLQDFNQKFNAWFESVIGDPDPSETI